jgi:type VI secretion system secreted protein Hcp
MHKPLTIVKEVDKSSPKLMEACVKGTHVGNVEVWARDGGQATLRYTLQDAIISSYSISGPSASSPRPTESVSFSFEKIVLGPTGPEAVGASTAPRAN